MTPVVTESTAAIDTCTVCGKQSGRNDDFTHVILGHHGVLVVCEMDLDRLAVMSEMPVGIS